MIIDDISRPMMQQNLPKTSRWESKSGYHCNLEITALLQTAHWD
jgi:hypothetical protein